MTANAKPTKKRIETSGSLRLGKEAHGVQQKSKGSREGQRNNASRLDRKVSRNAPMKKHLPLGDNHPARFVGTEVSDDLYTRFSEAAKRTNRSRSGLIRHLMENVDLILPPGDNHLSARPRRPALNRHE